MSIVSHAQNYEDVRLFRAFSDIKCGRYLDIGTQGPVHDSVSLAFYEHGWRGVHVEPTPTYAQQMRAARPDETVIQAAVSCEPGPIKFFEIAETGLSTGIEHIAKDHAHANWDHRLIMVPTVTLASLFDLMGEDLIHWLKIDVEGMEADVIKSWGRHRARPAALVIEATAPNTQIKTHLEWYNMILERGYHDVLFDGLSRYFIHEKHIERGEVLSLSPNIFDRFQVTDTHFTAKILGTNHNAALNAERAQAEVVLNIVKADLEAQLNAERAQTEVMLNIVKADLEAQISAANIALNETQRTLRSLQQEKLDLVYETGKLQGALNAQSEANTIECERLYSRISWHEMQLLKAIDLISATSDPLAELRGFSSMFIRWLIGKKKITAIIDHKMAVANWRNESILNEISAKGNLPQANSSPVANEMLESKEFIPMENDKLITTVPQLLAPHDRQFIHTSYRSVLGRAPDAEGEEYYLNLLRAGTHKLEILKRLRRSREGKQFIPGVAGLDRAIKHHIYANIPIIGSFIKPIIKYVDSSLNNDQPSLLTENEPFFTELKTPYHDWQVRKDSELKKEIIGFDQYLPSLDYGLIECIRSGVIIEKHINANSRLIARSIFVALLRRFPDETSIDNIERKINYGISIKNIIIDIQKSHEFINIGYRQYPK